MDIDYGTAVTTKNVTRTVFTVTIRCSLRRVDETRSKLISELNAKL